MKAISIRQPWAGLSAAGIKLIENRSRPTKYRGEILIHASKSTYKDIVTAQYCDRILGAEGYAEFLQSTKLYFGAFIAVADLVDCVSDDDSEWFCGPFGYVFRNVKQIEPVPFKGQLGIFNVPDSIKRSIRETLKRECA